MKPEATSRRGGNEEFRYCAACQQPFTGLDKCPMCGSYAMPPVAPRRKGVYIGAPACFALEEAIRPVCEAFGAYRGSGGCYVVGSALEGPRWRDVDVRLMLSDEAFAREFPAAGEHWEHDARWIVLTVAISERLSRLTGLPIDFQIQPTTRTNERHKGRRNAIGIIITSSAEAQPAASVVAEEPSRKPSSSALAEILREQIQILRDIHAPQHLIDVAERVLAEAEALSGRSPTQEKAAGRCADCGVGLNEGEAKTFTVCDACWDKAAGSRGR